MAGCSPSAGTPSGCSCTCWPRRSGSAASWSLAALVPVLRRFGSDALGAAARRFNQVAWTAFGVLIVTGIWNVTAVSPQVSHDAGYRTTLIVKLAAVAISGLTAAL